MLSGNDEAAIAAARIIATECETPNAANRFASSLIFEIVNFYNFN